MIFPVLNRFTITKNQIPSLLSSLCQKNTLAILDYTNENKQNHSKNYGEIMSLIQRYPKEYVSVKLSSLDIQSTPRVETYLQNIVEYSIQKQSKILVDAEDNLIHYEINSTVDKFIKEYNKKDVNIYKTIQMYRKDSFSILKENLEHDREHKLGIKLVRGAYYNQDAKHDILYSTIQETHDNYNNGIVYFAENSLKDDVLMCATHNEKSISIAKKNVPSHQLEFAHLLGMSDKTSLQLAKENYKMFKYVPYGNFQDTVPYLLRRLYENYPMLLNIWK
jgi:proline dehydrogenase